MGTMAKRWIAFAAAGWLASASVACSDSAGSKVNVTGTDAGDEGAFDTGVELRVPVPAQGRVFVKLETPEVTTLAEDPSVALDWDLAFEGYEVFTNGGASGKGAGTAFGPLDALVFVGDVAPEVPFMNADKASGAFLDWYAYDGRAHALYSRYHVYGVQEDDRLFKVQVLTYYGEREGAAVGALYKVRYAELNADGTVGPTTELENLDATAGGTQSPADAPNEVLDLATGTRSMLTPAAAAASTAWSLSFRRVNVGVNGDHGGPRGTKAVDLSADETANEALADVMNRTEATELARFEAVTRTSFDGKTFHGDRITSAFGTAWLTAGASPPIPARAAWLVSDARGKKYLIGFIGFEGADEASPGTIVMKIKPVSG